LGVAPKPPSPNPQSPIPTIKVNKLSNSIS
jgi:hypothetical protein